MSDPVAEARPAPLHDLPNSAPARNPPIHLRSPSVESFDTTIPNISRRNSIVTITTVGDSDINDARDPHGGSYTLSALDTRSASDAPPDYNSIYPTSHPNHIPTSNAINKTGRGNPDLRTPNFVEQLRRRLDGSISSRAPSVATSTSTVASTRSSPRSSFLSNCPVYQPRASISSASPSYHSYDPRRQRCLRQGSISSAAPSYVTRDSASTWSASTISLESSSRTNSTATDITDASIAGSSNPRKHSFPGMITSELHSARNDILQGYHDARHHLSTGFQEMNRNINEGMVLAREEIGRALKDIKLTSSTEKEGDLAPEPFRVYRLRQQLKADGLVALHEDVERYHRRKNRKHEAKRRAKLEAKEAKDARKQDKRQYKNRGLPAPDI